MSPFPGLPSFRRRWAGGELMDDPTSDPERLRRTLRHFRFINRIFSRSRGLLRRWILRDVPADEVGHGVRVIELGGGDAELSRWLYRHLERYRGRRTTDGGRPMAPGIAVVSIDHDSRVHRLAEENHDGTPVALVHGRAPEDIPDGPIDYVFGNHFLHHLTDDEIVTLLASLRERRVRRCLFNDLHRSPLPYFGFTLFAGIFLRGSFAYFDGRASIRRGFLLRELEALSREAGYSRFQAYKRFPGHVVLVLETG